MVPLGMDLVGFKVEDLLQAAPGGGCHPGLLPFEPGGLDQGGGEIHETHPGVDGSSGIADRGRPAHGEGQVVGELVFLTLGPGKGIPLSEVTMIRVLSSSPIFSR